MKQFKPCKFCLVIKSLEDFHKSNNKDGRFNVCKICHHIRTKKWMANNREKVPQYQRTSRIRHRYGISDKDFDKLVAFQGGKCCVCGDIPDPKSSNRTNKLHVDHCHKTGKIRALLCHLCNRGIGLFRERQDLLRKAFEYLDHHDSMV